MRMRKKPNLIPRMERCADVHIKKIENLKGRWLEEFSDYNELHIELGCGKGRFTAGTARQNPGVLFVAIEKVPEALVVAMERTCEQELQNMRFISGDVLNITEMFAPGEPSRIYINFCDPWPKSKYAKHRLTAPGFLKLYSQILPKGGEIHFKTDNIPLFDYSLDQFEACNWQLREVTNDLHGDGPARIMTDYEAKFHGKGVKINRCVAVKTEETI